MTLLLFLSYLKTLSMELTGTFYLISLVMKHKKKSFCKNV